MIYDPGFEQAQRFLTLLEYPRGAADDLEVLRRAVKIVEALQEDLSLALEIRGLWVARMVERRYLGSTIARVLETASGPTAVTRLKGQYTNLLQLAREGRQSVGTLQLIDDIISWANLAIKDRSLPEEFRKRVWHKKKIVEDFRDRLLGRDGYT